MTLEKTVKKYREMFKSGPVITTAHTDKGHFYVSPNSPEPYHSVTYYTSFIKDPSLANWKMNRALEYVKKIYLETAPYELSEEEFSKLMEQAKLAPEGEFKGAGDIGTQTHAWRQEWFEAIIESGAWQLTDADIDGYPLPLNADPEVISGCRAIKRFLKETGAMPLFTEMALVDDQLKVGGTLDDCFLMPNPIKVPTSDPVLGEGYKTVYKPYVCFCDLKTSNQGRKPAYAYQVRGFYYRMFVKTFGFKPKKTIILHTSKLDGTYKIIDLTDMKFLIKDAADLVRLSRSWDSVTQAFKPKQIII